LKKKAIAKAKSDSWNNFITALDASKSNDSWRFTNKIIGSAPSPSSNYPVVDSSGAPLISTQEKAELFLHTLSAHTSTPPSCTGAADKEKFFTSKTDAAISSEVPNPLNSKITLSELSSGLQNLKSRALGPDLIHNEMLKQLSPVNRRSLLHLFNLFFVSGFSPNHWKTAIVVPLLKPGKPPKDVNS
jgi:hypothetical protein